MLIDHHGQQIVWLKTRNLHLCFGTNVGTNQAKIEKISISRVIGLEFVRSLVSATRYEANKVHRRREERPMGSLAVNMLRDLRRRARGLAQRARQSESTLRITGQYDVKDRRAQ